MIERDRELERPNQVARELDPQQLAPIIDLAEYVANRGTLAKEFLAMIHAVLAGARTADADPSPSGLPDWLVNTPVDDAPLSEAALEKIAESEADLATGNESPGDEAFRRLLG